MVVGDVQAAVIGHQEGHGGVLGGGALAGEPEIDPVAWLEELVGTPVDLRALVLDEQDMPQRVYGGLVFPFQPIVTEPLVEDIT